MTDSIDPIANLVFVNSAETNIKCYVDMDEFSNIFLILLNGNGMSCDTVNKINRNFFFFQNLKRRNVAGSLFYDFLIFNCFLFNYKYIFWLLMVNILMNMVHLLILNEFLVHKYGSFTFVWRLHFCNTFNYYTYTHSHILIGSNHVREIYIENNRKCILIYFLKVFDF